MFGSRTAPLCQRSKKEMNKALERREKSGKAGASKE